jgi:hypothetical protein
VGMFLLKIELMDGRKVQEILVFLVFLWVDDGEVVS